MSPALTLDRIVFPSDESLRAPIVELFYENLGERLAWSLLPRERPRVISLLTSSLRLSQAYAGLNEAGYLLAFALVTDRGNLLCLEQGWLHKTWGPWGAVWRNVMFRALHVGECRRGTLRLEALVVRPECRGRGIGSQLMTRIVADARAQGHASLIIDVGDDNTEARHLYEGFGFRVTRTVWVPSLKPLGIRNVALMRLDL